MTRQIRTTVILLVFAVVAVFGLSIARYWLAEPAPVEQPPDLASANIYVYEQPRPVIEFELTDENGQIVTRENLRGHWTFAFVGYTNCPDICPVAMAALRQTNKLLPATLPQPRYLLISADPEHDTPEVLKNYTGFFGENFHGYSGDIDITRALATSLGAVFVQRETEGGLLVDHSGHFALIGPSAEVVALIQPPHKPQQLADGFEQIYRWADRQRQTNSSAY